MYLPKIVSLFNIMSKIKLPRDLSQRHIEALNEARCHIALEYMYANGDEVTHAELTKSYAELSTLARAFQSRAYAEFKWAHAGKVYMYQDDLVWTGCTCMIYAEQTFAECSSEAENS